MRLTQTQVKILKHVATEVFGPTVRLRLFGSRTDPQQRGGDINLTEIMLSEKDALDAKLYFLLKGKQQLGDQRIDVILPSAPGQTPTPIHQVAEQTGILL